MYTVIQIMGFFLFHCVVCYLNWKSKVYTFYYKQEKCWWMF